MNKITSILIIGLFSISVWPGLPQAEEAQQKKKIMVCEVYFDENEPSKNWVELCNPHDETITLHRFRTSNILGLDCLPADIREKGGIAFAPGQVMVLCADNAVFTREWRNSIDLVEVEMLKELGSFGYIAAQTKDSEEFVFDVVMYGSTNNAYRQVFPDHQLLPFCTDAKSYRRNIEKKGESVMMSDFVASEPDPGNR